MTLEDFFTLTEMKDGLTAPSRVEELVTVMQKEKDYVVKNVGEATRQWSTVASTIAATENKECLDLFIQLDGLSFISRWLKNAQKFYSDASDSVVEESITSLLRALERLHIDSEKSNSSGIRITVKNLLGHSSSKVQDMARALFESWEWVKDSDEVFSDAEKVGVVGSFNEDERTKVIADGKSGSSESIAAQCKGSSSERNLIEPIGDEHLPPRSLDGLQSEKVKDLQFEASRNQSSSLTVADHADMMERSLGAPCSSSTIQDYRSIKEEYPRPEGNSSVSTSCSPDAIPCLNEGRVDVQSLDDRKLPDKINSSTDWGVASASCVPEAGPLSSSGDAANAGQSLKEPTMENDIDTKDGDARIHVSGTINGMDNNLKVENLDVTFSRKEDMKPAEEDEEQQSDEDGEQKSDEDEDMVDVSEFSKLATDSKSSEVIDKRSDIEREYGIVDALEVARQVAKAVEREVVDYRERFNSSSSDKNSEGLSGLPGSPDSVSGEDNISGVSPAKETTAAQGISVEASPDRVTHLTSPDNQDNEPENCTHDIESSHVTEAAQEPEGNREKGMCDFDLNQEVSSEEGDWSVNPVSTSVSVVSASRAAAVPGLPAAPLQFEGTLGWKGSAATSAFRPASPRRIPEGDKISTRGSSSSPKQRQDVLNIDLNVVEDVDDKNVDLILGKHHPVSSGLPSGESSVEVSPRRSEKLMLDLNRMDDDGDAPPSDWRAEGRLSYHRNGHRSPSPASSSSTMQPCMRNFDLNDRPSVHNDLFDQQPYLGRSSSQYDNSYGGLKPVDPVISIMGARVEVNRKDFVPPTMSLSNGKPPDIAMDSNLARTASFLGAGPTLSYSHSAAYGYNGLTTGPTLSFSPVYGPGGSIPYMVDSRGAPVIPQILGSASAVPPSYSQPPFIMSLSGPPPALDGGGISRPNLDLNSGFVIDGGENRDAGGSRQLFISGRLVDEHLRAESQPSSSSGIGGKRKEPDGWEPPYPFNLKRHQPPWK